jgi:hypothetical protein
LRRLREPGLMRVQGHRAGPEERRWTVAVACPTVSCARFVPRTRDSEPCPVWRCRFVRGHRCPEPPLASAWGSGPGCLPDGRGAGSAPFWPESDVCPQWHHRRIGMGARGRTRRHYTGANRRRRKRGRGGTNTSRLRRAQRVRCHDEKAQSRTDFGSVTYTFEDRSVSDRWVVAMTYSFLGQIPWRFNSTPF